MASRNPVSSGPDFVLALRNALEKAEGAYSKPPLTGGTQISCRFADDRLAMLDAISEQSGWNRNQLISALLDRGLFELFRHLEDDVMERIMMHTTDKVAPTFDVSAAIMNEIAAYNRFRIFPAPQRIRKDQLPEALNSKWLLARTDRDRGLLEFSSGAMGWSMPLHVSHVERVTCDSLQDAKDTFKNAMLELNVQVVMHGNEISLLPISDSSSPLKRRRILRRSPSR